VVYKPLNCDTGINNIKNSSFYNQLNAVLLHYIGKEFNYFCNRMKQTNTERVWSKRTLCQIYTLWATCVVFFKNIRLDVTVITTSLRDLRNYIFLFAVYNQQDATFLNLFISVGVRRSRCFRRDFPPIIRSSKLHIQCQVFVRPMLLPVASSR